MFGPSKASSSALQAAASFLKYTMASRQALSETRAAENDEAVCQERLQSMITTVLNESGKPLVPATPNSTADIAWVINCPRGLESTDISVVCDAIVCSDATFRSSNVWLALRVREFLWGDCLLVCLLACIAYAPEV